MEINKNTKSIIFICTGNTCRSAMISAMMKKKIADNKLDVRIDSAGIYAMSDAPATQYAIEVMEESGIDLTIHRAKQISAELLKQFDIIFCMATQHKILTENLFPEFGNKIFLLSQVNNENLDIPDPFGHSKSFYNTVADALEMYANLILDQLK